MPSAAEEGEREERQWVLPASRTDRAFSTKKYRLPTVFNPQVTGSVEVQATNGVLPPARKSVYG